ncbi:MAG: flagellar biosynthesis protein FlhF [Aureliella sp.]
MSIHTFRAESLQAALEQVRDALGPDASILNTREKRQGRLGMFARTFIEVEATLDTPFPSHFADRSQVTQRVNSTRQAVNRQSPASFNDNQSQASSADRASASESADTSVADFGLETLSAAMLEVQADLLSSGMSSSTVARLMCEAVEQGRGDQSAGALDDPWALRGRIGQCIAKRLSVAGSIELTGNKPEIVAFVGPTGVGKTTTLAKIAAGFRFDLGCRIGLIALDTCRLGAVDQLLQYAELVSAPLEVVSSPEQVTAALQRLSDCDLVLLDTAGRAPRDVEQLAELRKFLLLAHPHSTQLVVSATSSASHVTQTVERFSVLAPTNLLITKLDEAVDFGSWLTLLECTPLSISYLTHGQQVPQDIMVASARRLSSLLVGQTPNRIV